MTVLFFVLVGSTLKNSQGFFFHQWDMMTLEKRPAFAFLNPGSILFELIKSCCIFWRRRSKVSCHLPWHTRKRHRGGGKNDKNMFSHQCHHRHCPNCLVARPIYVAALTLAFDTSERNALVNMWKCKQTLSLFQKSTYQNVDRTPIRKNVMPKYLIKIPRDNKVLILI